MDLNLIGLMLARNEDWIIGYSARAALKWCDGLVILDHGSTDRTPEIIRELEEEFPDRVHPFRTTDPDWNEMDHRQFTLDRGRELGAHTFAIVDCDEVLTGPFVPGYEEEGKKNIRNLLWELKDGEVLEVPMLAVWRSPMQYRADGSIWSRGYIPVGFCDKSDLTWRPKQDGYQHHARNPFGITGKVRVSVDKHTFGGVMHYQFADWGRLTAKHAWYKMMETIKYPGRRSPAKINRQYNEALREIDLQTRPIPFDFVTPYSDLLSEGRLVLGKESWHVAECRRLVEQHGREKFNGLDLFGVV